MGSMNTNRTPQLLAEMEIQSILTYKLFTIESKLNISTIRVRGSPHSLNAVTCVLSTGAA